MGLKTDDLDLQGQIGLKINKICVIPCECNIFEPVGFLSSKLRCILII